MGDQILYSTNVFLKYLIHQKYRNDIHYVWCSESFDCKIFSPYSHASLVAPSSNPADIYRELSRDVRGRDSHSAKINAQKASFIALGTEWALRGEITPEQRDEIIYMAQNSSFDYWRPLIYVIPRNIVASRMAPVPIASRASYGNEYIISDLKSNEFDIVELKND